MCKVRHREAASDFNAALAEYRQYLQRAAAAAAMRAAAEAAGPPAGGPEAGVSSDQSSFRLKPGETLRLPAVKVNGRSSSQVCQVFKALIPFQERARQGPRTAPPCEHAHAGA